MARAFVSGSSQYLEVASALLTGPPLTFAAWALPNSSNANAILSIANNGSTQNYLAIYCAGGNLTARANDGGAATGATKSFSNSVWSHFAGTFASSTSRTAYVNGVAGSAESTSSTPGSLNRTAIGRITASTPTLFFDGNIAEAAIWNIALSQADLTALAAAVSPLLVRPDALVAYWPLLGLYSPEIDIRAHNDATVTGATVAGHPRMFWNVGRNACATAGHRRGEGRCFSVSEGVRRRRSRPGGQDRDGPERAREVICRQSAGSGLSV